MKTLRVLSLGAGVQSTTIALRIADGEYPPIDCAIFADTGEEPAAVYRHLDWLVAQTAGHFPTRIVTAGRLGDALMGSGRFASIPAFTTGAGGDDDEGGILRRQCTAEYKLAPIERFIRRTLLGLKPGQRIPRDTVVTQILGLSADEPRRVLRVRANAEPWMRPEFPLHDAGETRANCLAYLERRVPHPVPRSACTFCPYHDNAEWRSIRAHDPAAWARAVEIDAALRRPHRTIKGQMYLHRSLVPLSEADLSGPDPAPLQYGLRFERECLGMCGT